MKGIQKRAFHRCSHLCLKAQNKGEYRQSESLRISPQYSIGKSLRLYLKGGQQCWKQNSQVISSLIFQFHPQKRLICLTTSGRLDKMPIRAMTENSCERQLSERVKIRFFSAPPCCRVTSFFFISKGIPLDPPL